MDAHSLTQEIKRKALELGFVRVGVTTADPIEGYEDELLRREGYDIWKVESDQSPLRRMAHPETAVPQAKSIITLVRSIGSIDYPEELVNHIARTYLGRSYVPPANTVEGQRVALFEEHLRKLGVNSFYSHTNFQLVDRALAARAGVIEYGRNNFAYAGEYGSFIVLISIPVDVELECEVHEPKRPCPDDCRKCVEACPTHAMAEDGSLNPQRCVLFNCIRNGSLRNQEVLDLLGERIHGCDECQLVCPRNQAALSGPKVKDPYLEWLKNEFSLEKLLFCDEEYYEACVKPVMFNYISDLDIFRQSAAVAMGNSGDVRYLPALRRAVEEGSDDVRMRAVHAIDLIEAGASA